MLDVPLPMVTMLVARLKTALAPTRPESTVDRLRRLARKAIGF
ncbi:MAG: hypothetical protein ACKV19_14270 [Verrucomicrobiales bacterium]